MKIYLAGGMTVINVKGKERDLSNRLPTWKRLFSYHFEHLLHKSEILDIKHEDLYGKPRKKKPKNKTKPTQHEDQKE